MLIECLQRRVRAIPKEQGGGSKVGSTISLPDGEGNYSDFEFKPINPAAPKGPHVCEFDPEQHPVEIATLLAIKEGFRKFDPTAKSAGKAKQGAPAGDPLLARAGITPPVKPEGEKAGPATYDGELPDFDAFKNKKDLFKWIGDHVPALAAQLSVSLPMGRLVQAVRDAQAAGAK